jgi:DNA primase catalytic subunit
MVWYAILNEYRSERRVNDLRDRLQRKENELSTLSVSSVPARQLDEIKRSMEKKDEKIRTLEMTLAVKDEQVRADKAEMVSRLQFQDLTEQLM